MAVRSERRGTWGRWLVQQRKEHGNLTQEAVRETLAKMGHPISEAYYGDFERGKATPNADWQEVFERLWGSLPEEESQPAQAAGAVSPDIAALVGAIDRLIGVTERQTELLARLWPTMAEVGAGIRTSNNQAGAQTEAILQLSRDFELQSEIRTGRTDAVADSLHVLNEKLDLLVDRTGSVDERVAPPTREPSPTRRRP